MRIEDRERRGIVRLATWNIHAGRGIDGTYDLGRTIAILRRHDPDIVALQELDSRGREVAPLAYLAETLGGHAAEARTITAPDGHYGHAVISRWPFTRTRLHDLSESRREPRAAIETWIETPYGALHLTAVHLGLRFGERRRQAARLAKIAEPGAAATVMLGDFNEWGWRGPVRRTLAVVMQGRTRHRTFPARWPLLRLDRIYCRPAEALIRSWTDRAAREASDHLPVIADIRMPMAPAALTP
ncbi:endonuclease/exonuclease/phosphatase family protein [Desertibaculum subflavum]|uniref:endonuclease/exonuclease/phosphatase family protein n=1 Tax=Desertibaculum subflavum TaxID=2268458 RepID=UPI000E665772